MPLAGSFSQKNEAEDHRAEPPTGKGSDSAITQGANRGMDRQATGEKADAGEDRELKYFLWQRTSQTFPDIEKISDDKNGKDCKFGCNQGEHSHASTRREYPRLLQR